MEKQAATGIIKLSGYELQYRVEGEGLPALVIGSSKFYPRVFSEEIRVHFQFIFVDHRGFVPPPEREVAEQKITLDTILQDVEALRKKLSLDKFLIIGHSGHAFMALEYAKQYPQHVLGIVMMAVSPDYSADTHQKTAAFFERQASAERKAYYQKKMASLPALIGGDPDQRFVNYCLCSGARNWYQYDFDASALWQDVYTNMPIIDHVWGIAFRDIDIRKGLENLDKPVLLLLGRHDYVTGPAELWNTVRHAFKDIQIHVLEKSGHYPSCEEPEAFDSLLKSWVNEKLIQPAV